MPRPAFRLFALLACLVLSGCGGPAKGTVIPLPPGAPVRPAPDLGGLLSFTPGPAPAPLAPALPPGNGRLVYRDGRREMIIPAEGGAPQPLEAAVAGERIGYIGSWAPNHQAALVIGPGPDRTDTNVYYAAGSDGANPQLIGSIGAECINFSDPIWAPDGSKAIVVTELFPDADQTGCHTDEPIATPIHLLDLKALTLRQLADEQSIDLFDIERRLAWSPDGSMIAYATGDTFDDEAPRELRTISLADPKPATMLRDLMIGSLFWPGPGELLLEAPCDGSRRTQLCAFDLASGKAEPLYRTEADAAFGFVSMSPDGAWLLAHESRRDLVMLINRRSGATEIIPDSAKLYSFSAIWSPNSRYVAMRGADSLVHAYEVGSDRPAAPLMSEHLEAWLP